MLIITLTPQQHVNLLKLFRKMKMKGDDAYAYVELKNLIINAQNAQPITKEELLKKNAEAKPKEKLNNNRKEQKNG